jgi:hypothetical protein
VSEGFLGLPKVARSCPRLPNPLAHAELVGVCGAGVGQPTQRHTRRSFGPV